ncbi:catechol O-methyltransferase A [Hoplias malabaricus]|uniref:catechol O-methyltransferase A n=1 Tax=Hoplias malabaricus TaxID=27720 RepID=UPI00346353A3
MECCTLVCVGAVVVLLAVCSWLVAALQKVGFVSLMWNDFIIQRLRDKFTQTTRPQRVLKAVQTLATKGNPESVISTIDHFCKHTEWAMNVGDEKGYILDSVVTEVNPSTALELGTYCGYSAIRIARLLSPGSKLITVEFNPDYAAIAKKIIAFAGLEDKITLVEGSTGDWIPKLKDHFGISTFDFVFLDHWKDRYVADTKLLEECSLLRKGSVLLADNVICPGAPEYLEYIRKSPRYESKYYQSHLEYTQVEDGLEKSVFLG